MDLISTNPGPFYVQLPDPYRGHPEVVGRVFYTIPLQLLDELVAKCGRAAFDADRLELEKTLAQSLGHNPQLIGYTKEGEGFSYPLLTRDEPRLPNPDDETLKKMGKTREGYDEFLREARHRLGFYVDASRGYAGWLVTNPVFLRERDELLQRWKDQVAVQGIPRNDLTTFGGVPHQDFFRPAYDTDVLKFLNAFADWYARWRLHHLITRELPEPLSSQIPILNPLSLLTHLQAGGVTLYQPDTMPIPPRDDLRNALEDVRVNRKNDHLREWIEIVGSGRHNDHSSRAFGQIFIFNHYWTILEERHPSLLAGRVRQMQKAFAEYLYVSPAAVDKYRQRIRNRLPLVNEPAP